MGKLDPLAGSCEDHPVLAHDVSATQRGKADIPLAARAGVPIARSDALVAECHVAPLGGSPA